VVAAPPTPRRKMYHGRGQQRSGLRRGGGAFNKRAIEPRLISYVKPRRKRYRGEVADMDVEETTEMTKVEINLKTLLLRVGDGREDLHKHVSMLANVLEEDLSTHSAFINGMLLDCVKNLSNKTPVYGCLAALVGVRKPEFAKALVDALCLDLKEEIVRGRIHGFHVRNMVRFTCSLVNVGMVSAPGLFATLKGLLDYAAKSPSPRKDHTIYTVVASLLWLDKAVLEDEATGGPAAVAALLATASDLAEVPPEVLVRLAPPEAKAGSNPPEGRLMVLIRLVKEAKDQGWPALKNVVRPHERFAEELKKKREDEKFAPIEFKLDVVSQAGVAGTSSGEGSTGGGRGEEDEKGSGGKKAGGGSAVSQGWGMVGYPIRLLPRKMDGGITDLERWMARDAITETINLFRDSYKVCAARLMALSFSFPHKHLVMEGIASSILSLPCMDPPLVWHCALVYEAFRLDVKSMAPLFALTMQALYKRLGRLDVGLLDTAADWFSLHISNFSYQWLWDKWAGAAEQSPGDPQRVFVEEVLRRCMRLSRRGLPSLPSALRSLEPPAPGFKFHYNPSTYVSPAAPTLASEGGEAAAAAAAKDEEEDDDDDANTRRREMESEEAAGVGRDAAGEEGKGPGGKADEEKVKVTELALDLIDLIEDKDRRAAVVSHWLDQNALPSVEPGDPCFRLNLFFACLLQSGRKSPTHFVSLLARHRDEIKTLVNSPKMAMRVMQLCAEFHREDESRLVTVVGKLLNFAIIHPTQAVKWALGEGYSKEGRRRWSFVYYEILRNATLRTIQRRRMIASKDLGIDDNGKQRSGLLRFAEHQEKNIILQAFKRFAEMLTELEGEGEGNEAADGDDDAEKSSEHEALARKEERRHVLGRMREYGRRFPTEFKRYFSAIQDVVAANPTAVEEVARLAKLIRPQSADDNNVDPS